MASRSMSSMRMVLRYAGGRGASRCESGASREPSRGGDPGSGAAAAAGAPAEALEARAPDLVRVRVRVRVRARAKVRVRVRVRIARPEQTGWVVCI